LLLIVFGTTEITMDEMGEINEYIQSEAGYSANIIMGAGEDANLGEAVSVTIIATGFNVEQQAGIVNAEPQKIIHSLEDDQKLVHDLTAKTINNITVDNPIFETAPEVKNDIINPFVMKLQQIK
jgi:cell division protein FtsZ